MAASVLYVIASGQPGFSIDHHAAGAFATNGYGARSPGGYSLLAALVTELVLTAFFLWIILGATDTRAPKGFAPIAIGFGLTLIHLVSIPVTNTSVNPARSIGPALFAGGGAIGQLWLFILAPIAGAAIAGISYALLLGQQQQPSRCRRPPRDDPHRHPPRPPGTPMPASALTPIWVSTPWLPIPIPAWRSQDGQVFFSDAQVATITTTGGGRQRFQRKVTGGWLHHRGPGEPSTVPALRFAGHTYYQLPGHWLAVPGPIPG